MAAHSQEGVGAGREDFYFLGHLEMLLASSKKACGGYFNFQEVLYWLKYVFLIFKGTILQTC